MEYEFKERESWKRNRSVVAGRSNRGQIIWKRENPVGRGDIFLVRLGKDASRQVVGSTDDAVAALEELESELRSGEYKPSTSNVRLDTFLQKHFLPWKKPSVVPKTFGGYVDIVERLIAPALGHHRLSDLSTTDVQEWVDGLWAEGLEPKTVRNYFSVLRASLRWAMNLGLISTNPSEGVDRRRRDEGWFLVDPDNEVPDKGVDPSLVWTVHEMQDFVEIASRDHEMTRWVIVGIRAGFRPGEQCALMWKDIDFETGEVRVRRAVIEMDKSRREQYGRWQLGPTKTNEKREVKLPPDAISALAEQKGYVESLLEAGKLSHERARFVFPVRRGPRNFNNPCNLKNRLRKFVIGRPDRDSASGLPGVRYIPPYGLRHTHATDLLRHDWRIWEVANRLGTSIKQIDEHYGHWLSDMEEKKLKQMTPLPGMSGGPEVVSETGGGRSAA